MAHARQQIRARTATVLTGLTTTGANVYASRVYPFDTLPCLAIYTTSEQVDTGSIGTKQERTLSLVVEARAKAALAGNVDNVIDTITAEVEAAIMADPTLNGLAKWTELAETDIELDDGADQAIAVARLTFLCLYRVDGTDPETVIA